MEPKKEGQSQSEEDSILELFGEITDFQNESNYDESKVEKLRVQRGDFVEKYFNHKILSEIRRSLSNFYRFRRSSQRFHLKLKLYFAKRVQQS